MLNGLVLVALSLPQVEPTAWVGLRTAAHASNIEVAERAFQQGIRVVDVLADSPAEAAGLQVGDIIVAIDGAEFDCPADELPDRFGAAIRSHKVGDTVEFLVFRDGIERRLRRDEQSNSLQWRDRSTARFRKRALRAPARRRCQWPCFSLSSTLRTLSSMVCGRSVRVPSLIVVEIRGAPIS